MKKKKNKKMKMKKKKNRPENCVENKEKRSFLWKNKQTNLNSKR